MKRAITVIGLVVLAVAVVAIGAAMYLVKDDKLMLTMDTDYCGLPSEINIKRTAGARAMNEIELRGHWNGVALAGLGTQSATDLGVQGGGEGVVIVHIDLDARQRAEQAGLMVGDIIVGIDDRQVKNLADVRSALKKVKGNEPVLVDVQRDTGLVTLVVPPPTQTASLGVQVMAGPQMVCPRDGTLVPASQAATNGGVCPLCGGPLHLIQPGAGVAQ